jgi:transcriptional regulator with XRE-family HTH domain
MIGEVLKEARIKKGLSMIDVSKMIGIDRTTYFRYENNQVKNIPVQNLLKLANILDIDLNKIKIK